MSVFPSHCNLSVVGDGKKSYTGGIICDFLDGDGFNLRGSKSPQSLASRRRSMKILEKAELICRIPTVRGGNSWSKFLIRVSAACSISLYRF